MIDTLLASAVGDPAGAFRWSSLGLDPVAVNLGFFQIRWYSLAYLAGIIVGWWYLLKLLAQPGAPMARRHADDLVFYATLGIILGGRIGYVLFYNLDYYLANPVAILTLWDGGMSFHGGVIGVTCALLWLARANGLSFLRVCDYVACCVPFGMFFGRLANFVNGELWGRATDVPWAMVFPRGGEVARHPSQLYEAGLEGLAVGLVLWVLFWRTDSRYYPGRLVGAFTLCIAIARFLVEFVRQPDAQLSEFAARTGLSMGQWLTIPMMLLGLWLIWSSTARRQRVEPIAGTASVA